MKTSSWRYRRSAAGSGRYRYGAIAHQHPGTEQEIQYLSSGNQQKVLLSRWLATQPCFLILDEPIRGIDLGAHADIIRAIEALCADGMALLAISGLAAFFFTAYS